MARTGIVQFERHPVAESELVTMRDVMGNRSPEFGGHAASGR